MPRPAPWTASTAPTEPSAPPHTQPVSPLPRLTLSHYADIESHLPAGNSGFVNQQIMGRSLPTLLSINEANGFPACRSLKVLKELNDPQGTKAGEIAPFTSLLL